MKDAISISDNIRNIYAALVAGVTPILVLTGLGTQHLHGHHYEIDRPFHVTTDLKHAAEITQTNSTRFWTTRSKLARNASTG
jgi:ribonucleotide monophosphatase NagD (HAD superfamily)